jgi:hypothetical protein
VSARTHVEADLWETIAADAALESPLWAESLRPVVDRSREPVFSLLARDEHALGLETIYEGYLVHYGRARLFDPPDDDAALLLGDYLYAHGLVRVATLGDARAVADLAELISLCSQLRADGRDGDGAAWGATASRLGTGGLAEARDALRLDGDPRALEGVARTFAGDDRFERAIAAHGRLVG